MGFQADVEAFNGRWQAKVWRRFTFTAPDEVRACSARFIAACRQRAAPRLENAPRRRRFPTDWYLDLQAPLQGRVTYLRRADDGGRVRVLGHTFTVAAPWRHRLVRAEVDLTAKQIRFYGLRRRHPLAQPLLSTHPYQPPLRRFQE